MTDAAQVKRITQEDVFRIGDAVLTLVASMQMLGHSNPLHSLDYRHGETDEWVQFAEDFATVCNRGGSAKAERDRLIAWADSRDLLRAVMERAWHSESVGESGVVK